MQLDRRAARKRSPEEALRIAVEDLGGLQEVGHIFKPEWTPERAGQWLSDCLRPDKRDKLSEAQKLLIWTRAHAIGAHEGFKAYAASIGYGAEPTTLDAQLVEVVKRAQAAQQVAAETASDLASLLDRPELFARMQAAGLKVGELT